MSHITGPDGSGIDWNTRAKSLVPDDIGDLSKADISNLTESVVLLLSPEVCGAIYDTFVDPGAADPDDLVVGLNPAVREMLELRMSLLGVLPWSTISVNMLKANTKLVAAINPEEATTIPSHDARELLNDPRMNMSSEVRAVLQRIATPPAGIVLPESPTIPVGIEVFPSAATKEVPVDAAAAKVLADTKPAFDATATTEANVAAAEAEKAAKDAKTAAAAAGEPAVSPAVYVFTEADVRNAEILEKEAHILNNMVRNYYPEGLLRREVVEKVTDYVKTVEDAKVAVEKAVADKTVIAANTAAKKRELVARKAREMADFSITHPPPNHDAANILVGKLTESAKKTADISGKTVAFTVNTTAAEDTAKAGKVVHDATKVTAAVAAEKAAVDAKVAATKPADATVKAAVDVATKAVITKPVDATVKTAATKATDAAPKAALTKATDTPPVTKAVAPVPIKVPVAKQGAHPATSADIIPGALKIPGLSMTDLSGVDEVIYNALLANNARVEKLDLEILNFMIAGFVAEHPGRLDQEEANYAVKVAMSTREYMGRTVGRILFERLHPDGFRLRHPIEETLTKYRSAAVTDRLTSVKSPPPGIERYASYGLSNSPLALPDNFTEVIMGVETGSADTLSLVAAYENYQRNRTADAYDKLIALYRSSMGQTLSASGR